MTNSVGLHFSEAGQGIPLVLLHGFPLDGSIWREQQQKLKDQYRVVTPDLRGHGGSPAPAGIYEMETLAGDVAALLDVLKIKQAVIMGHSMGGYVALALWKLAPERFLGLGLIGSQAGADTEEGRQGRYKTADKVAADGSKVMADAMIPKLFAPSLSADSPIVTQVKQIILNTPATGIIGTLKGMAARPDSTGQLSQIGVPALILAGQQDQIIPAAKATAMAGAMPKATLAIIDNAGHMPMLEQPEATTAAIRNFLQATLPTK